MVRHFGVALALIVATALLAGCRAASPTPTGGEPPTVSAIFSANQRTEQPTATRAPTATRRPTRTPDPSAAAPQRSQITERVIYDETLDQDWSTDASWGVKVDLADHSRAYSGTVAAAVTPLEDYGAFFLTLKADAKTSFPITDVVGVSLWLSGGDGYLMPDDLAVTVLGSNDYTYWVKGDTSVQASDPRPFSETRLRYLGITHSLAPGTWAEADVQLDQLAYDPDYRYVTGVYVKSDKDFRQTYYIDRVALLLVR